MVQKNYQKKVWHIGTYTKSFSFLVQLVTEILISKVIQLKWGGPQLYNVHCKYPVTSPPHYLLQVIHLEVGDTLHLQAYSSDFFTGTLYRLTMCVTLTTWDPSHFNRTLPGVEGTL